MSPKPAKTSSAVATTSAPETLNSLTSLRGVFALVVVFFHFQYFYPDLNFPSFFKKGYLAVDFFFILSGFILSYVYVQEFRTVSYGTYHRFIVNRLARIYPLHVFTLFLLAFVSYVFGQSMDWHVGTIKDLPPSILLSNLMMTHSWGFNSQLTMNFPSWSISCEWFVYMLFPVMAWGTTFLQEKRRWWPVVLILSLLPIWGFHEFAGAGIATGSSGRFDLTGDFGLVRAMCEFFSGMMVYKIFRVFQMQQWDREIVVTAASAQIANICLLLLAFLFFRGYDDLLIVSMIPPLILALALAQGTSWHVLESRPMVFLGEISYSIYLVHFTVAAAWGQWRRYIEIYVHDAWKVLFYFLMVGTVVLVSWGLYRWVEIPARRYVRNLALPPETTRTRVWSLLGIYFLMVPFLWFALEADAYRALVNYF